MVLCAICHNTNETMHLCDKCKLENPDWFESPREVPTASISFEKLPSGYFQLQGHMPRRRPVLAHRSNKPKMIAALFSSSFVREPHTSRNRTKWVCRPLSQVEVAWLCNCSVQYVHRVIRAFEGLETRRQRAIALSEMSNT